MKKLTCLLTVISLFFFSCSNSTNEKSNEKAEAATQEEHHHDDESAAIELNNGVKWTVDAHMLTHIRNMENDVLSFTKVEQKDFKSFAGILQTNIELLTSNCTMKGKAHDELHKWLLPYIDTVNDLSTAKDNTEAARLFENIQASFIIFNTYFQ